MSSTGGEEFDVILREVGNRGKFQKRMLFLFVMPFLIFNPQQYNYFFMLGEPDHWCYVPGRDPHTTPEQWKSMTIPKNDDDYSSCKQFISPNSTDEVNCANGWVYSADTYKETAVLYYNWVCDDAYIVPIIYDLVYIGGAVGMMICGPLIDNVGRIPMIAVLTGIYFLFGTCSLLVDSSIAFMVLWFFRCLMNPACYNSVLILLTEYVVPEDRPPIQLALQLSWPFSTSILAFIAWATGGHWVTLGLITTVPFIYFVVIAKWTPESPRWLAARGKTERAENVIIKIATENNKPIPENLTERLTLSCQNQESPNINVFTLFKYPKQVFRIFCVICVDFAAFSTYEGSILNLNNVDGNVYLNFFILALMEIPGSLLGVYLLNKIGRRFSTFGFLLLAGFSCISAAFVPEDVTWAIVLFSGLGKLASAGLFMTFTTHITEIFPTPYRSIALTPSVITTNLASLALPWIIDLGKRNRILPFLIMSIGPLFTAMLYLFLPETHNKSLPQTIKDAQEFGNDQKFWSLNLTHIDHYTMTLENNKERQSSD